MGKAPSGAGETLNSELEIGMPGLAELADGISKRHGLEHSPELERLLDRLFGLSCRDQEQFAFDPARMAERRRRGFSLAKSMRKEAAAMLLGLERLHRDWLAFADEVRMSPALLEAIFDVDTRAPNELYLPDELSVLQTLFRSPEDDNADDMRETARAPIPLTELSPEAVCPTGFWEAADWRLKAVRSLPVRHRLPKGPVPNAVVRAAVSACRSYWTAAGLKWSMAGLKAAVIREENVVDNLTGRCEKFVADALTNTGIKFNLPELHTAWEFIDANARARPPTVRG